MNNFYKTMENFYKTMEKNKMYGNKWKILYIC